MAFVNTPNEGVPFYRGVEPKVPVPDNTAAEIISRGTATGVSAFVQMALGAERAKLAQAEMLQRADLSARELEFKREHMQDAHGLAIRGQDIQKMGYGLQQQSINNALWYNSEQVKMEQGQQESIIDNRESLTNLHDQQAKMYKSAFTTAVETANKRANYVEEAGETARQLELEGDPGANPYLYGKNAIGYDKLYGSSVDPFIKKKVQEYLKKAQESKVKLPDEQGNMTEYPWIQVVQDIDLNGVSSPFVPALRKAGFFEKAPTDPKTGKPLFDPNVFPTPKPELMKKLMQEKEGTPIKEIMGFKSRQDPFAQTGEAIMDKPIPGRKGMTAGDFNKTSALPAPTAGQAEREAAVAMAQAQKDPANAQFYRAKFLGRNPGSEALWTAQ